MRRLLDINNPIMRFLTAMFDLMALSVLWVVFSLPIFTMGAASTALYSAAYHHVRKGEDYLWNSVFSAEARTTSSTASGRRSKRI